MKKMSSDRSPVSAFSSESPLLTKSSEFRNADLVWIPEREACLSLAEIFCTDPSDRRGLRSASFPFYIIGPDEIGYHFRPSRAVVSELNNFLLISRPCLMILPENA